MIRPALLSTALAAVALGCAEITSCPIFDHVGGSKVPLDTRSDCSGAGRVLGEQGDDPVLTGLVTEDAGTDDTGDPDAGDGGAS